MTRFDGTAARQLDLLDYRQPAKVKKVQRASATVPAPRHPRRPDVDEDLVGGGYRLGNVLDAKHLRRAVPVVHDRLHDASPIPFRPATVSTTFPVFCPVSTYLVASMTSSSA